MSNLPSLYHLSTELQAVLESDDLTVEEWEQEVDRLLPAIQAKAGAVAHWIEYQEDMAGAIKERERKVREARQAMERRAERARKYLLDCMERAEAREIVDKRDGTIIKVVSNPPKVAVDDPAQIPEEYLVVPEPPPPRPDKGRISAALKAGEEVPGCRLEQSQRLKIT